jgi:hypothetical protein
MAQRLANNLGEILLAARCGAIDAAEAQELLATFVDIDEMRGRVEAFRSQRIRDELYPKLRVTIRKPRNVRELNAAVEAEALEYLAEVEAAERQAAQAIEA